MSALQKDLKNQQKKHQKKKPQQSAEFRNNVHQNAFLTNSFKNLQTEEYPQTDLHKNTRYSFFLLDELDLDSLLK